MKEKKTPGNIILQMKRYSIANTENPKLGMDTRFRWWYASAFFILKLWSQNYLNTCNRFVDSKGLRTF